MKKRKVTIIQRILPHYRLSFYQRLYEKLNKVGISFKLIYGQEEPGTVPKTVTVHDSWAIYCPNLYFHCCKQELIWQKIPPQYLETDILIIEQANRLLNNYSFLFRKRLNQKIAFWGHGRNRQASGWRLKEIIKRQLIAKVDWWFTYTDLSKQEVQKSGFPVDCITTVNNSIDTIKFQENISKVTQRQIDDIYSRFNITSPDLTCLYCGGLYPDKKLDFLISTCGKIKKILPGFSLIVVGGGPEENTIKEATSQYPWIHYTGPKFGTELAVYFRCASALLMPGPVGLVVIDSFNAGIPLFTTDNKIHGPEIAYLRQGENGFIAPYNEEAYCEAVISFLQNPSLKIEKACLQSADKYTLENMVTNFANGIQQCLTMEKK